jgi:hypothetical protein
MCKRTEICNCKTTLDEQKEFLYRYFLIETTKDLHIDGQTLRVPCCGIEIIREEIVGRDTISSYSESLECISPVRSKVINLIEYLRDNEVSPVHLTDIVGEMVDEWVVDFDIEAKSQLSQLVLA